MYIISTKFSMDYSTVQTYETFTFHGIIEVLCREVILYFSVVPAILGCTHSEGCVDVQRNDILIQRQHFQVELIDIEYYRDPRLINKAMLLHK